MIGEVVYKLRAKNSGRLSFINGRLMHAAFFKILNENSPALGDFVHNELNLKPFTVSFLNPAKNLPSFEENWLVKRNDVFFWRVTGLNAEILQAATSVPINYQIQAGALTLTLEKISDTEIVPIENFISQIKNLPPFREICFDFISPVAFRIDTFDAPYPRPELIFPSLADKWTQAELPAQVDKKIIRDLAADIHLTQWQGQSKKFYLARNRGTLAFWGKFFYNVEDLAQDVQKVFLLLAKFATFAGVGRLTGQGFGQTRAFFN
ncbi:MAG: CRISPR-associated endoribonuclease Cas6 [Selenomonadaceae bacterium]|nr:CRISPR-associated endoribonuclease Cas6 [Selenomonadaceae bacterium]